MGRKQKKNLLRLSAIAVFGIAFALIEASVVVYLRKLFGIESYGIYSPKVALNLGFIAFLSPGSFILPDTFITRIETLREAGTIIVLASVAFLSADNLRKRLGAFLVAFSVWDIFYYIFLNLFIGWPKSIWDIDVFFLIPTPWIGPVITPIVIFTVLLLLGIRLYTNEKTGK